MLIFHPQSSNRTRHHLSHHWDISQNVPMLSAAPRPGIGGAPLPNQPPNTSPSLYPPNEGPLLPPWLAYDKQVLCFRAYFRETLHEVYRSPFQVRLCKIFFYLEDGTVSVSEQKRENSGIALGCSLVSRQRIPLPPPCQNEFVTLLDLNVNRTVSIFSRVYHLIDCDLFTRHFLNRAGIQVPDPVDAPR